MAALVLKAKRFEGKTAVVTGSSAGIGLAIAHRFAAEGANVVVSSRIEKNVNDAVEYIRHREKGNPVSLLGVVAHVGEPNDRKKLIDETVKYFGRIDYLVANAAVNPWVGPLMDTQDTMWDKIFEVNVKASFSLVKHAQPYFNPGGSVILISSVGGYVHNKRLGAYATSKTAIFGLTRTLALALAPTIRVNCVAPGIFPTKFSEKMWKSDPAAAVTAEHGPVGLVPLQRLGRPDECASVVCFMCSDDAAYITGETVVVAGGVLSRL